MTRAALLVAGPDPFLDTLWLRNFATWRDQVDELRVIVNAQYDPDVQSYLAAQIDAVGGELTEFVGALDHGIALGRLMSTTTADQVLLMEEDAFVRHPKTVGEMFARIERGEVDLVGCPRSTGSPEVIDWANHRYGQLVASTGEAGPLFWPCFLWAKTADLRKVDHYSVWSGWEVYAFRFQNYQAMDTFGWASVQLRENGARVHTVPNYRADLAKMAEWGDMPWFHVGGLSTGWGMYIMEPLGLHDVTGLRDQEQTDWAKRVAFWSILADRADGPDWLRGPYRASIADFVRNAGTPPDLISQWRAAFERLITW